MEQKGKKSELSENLLSGSGSTDIKETGTSHKQLVEAISPSRPPATGSICLPPDLTHLHHHLSPLRVLPISTPLLSWAQKEKDIYSTMDTNSPNTFFPWLLREQEKDQLWIPKQITKLLYASVSSSAK